MIAALPPLGAMAQEGGATGGGGDVVDPAIWSLVGVAIASLVLGLLYLFKRETGGFDKQDWVAPIGIIYSADLPDDEPDAGHDTDGASH